MVTKYGAIVFTDIVGSSKLWKTYGDKMDIKSLNNFVFILFYSMLFWLFSQLLNPRRSREVDTSPNLLVGLEELIIDDITELRSVSRIQILLRTNIKS